jgi:putative flippase GtrA
MQQIKRAVTENPYTDWVYRRAGKMLAIDTVRFVIVGGLGFCINLSVLVILHDFTGLGVSISQLIGAELAILSNFYLHSTWTYKGAAEKPLATRLTQFHASAWVGSGITSAIVIISVNKLHVFYPVALVMGSLGGLTWNYIWTKYVIFKKAEL